MAVLLWVANLPPPRDQLMDCCQVVADDAVARDERAFVHLLTVSLQNWSAFANSVLKADGGRREGCLVKLWLLPLLLPELETGCPQMLP